MITTHTAQPCSNTPLKLKGILDTEFGQEKAVLGPCLSFRQKISKLKLRGHILRGHNSVLHLRTRVGGINTDVLGELMLNRITGNAECPSAVGEQRGRCSSGNTKILKKPS